MSNIQKGDRVTLHTRTRSFPARVVNPQSKGAKAKIWIRGDPFPVVVPIISIERNDSVPTAKELKDEARALGITNWEEMNKVELQAAIGLAQAEDEATETPSPIKTKKKVSKRPKRVSRKVKSGPEKAVAKRKTAPKRQARSKAKKRLPGVSLDGTNPFRKGSNMFVMTEILKHGGNRNDLAKQVKTKLRIRFPKYKKRGFSAVSYVSRYLLVVANRLEDEYGWTVKRQGRGKSQVIVAKPPKRR